MFNDTTKLISVGKVAVAAAVNALRTAGKGELSGVVSQEIIKALAKYNDLPAMVDVLTGTSDQMALTIPDLSTLQSVALGLENVATNVPAAAAGDKDKASNAAARLASFAAQQQMNNENAIKAIDKNGVVPAEYLAAVQKVVVAAVKVITAASGKTYASPKGRSPDELQMNVNAVFGTPGGRAGTLETTNTNVPVPPKVKTGQ